MGPNIRYLAAEYWDFYDHYLPLSHLSLEEGLRRITKSSDSSRASFPTRRARACLSSPRSLRFTGPFRSRGAFSANNSSSLRANLSLSKCQRERTTTAAPASGSRDRAAQISPDSRAVPGCCSAPRRARSRRLLRASWSFAKRTIHCGWGDGTVGSRSASALTVVRSALLAAGGLDAFLAAGGLDARFGT